MVISAPGQAVLWALRLVIRGHGRVMGRDLRTVFEATDMDGNAPMDKNG